MPSSYLRVTCAALAVSALLGGTAGAQWLKLKTPGLPRTADGKPNLKAPAPRQAARPDLSGLWRFNSEAYSSNVTVDLKPDEIDPKVVELYKQRMEDLGKDD